MSPKKKGKTQSQHKSAHVSTRSPMQLLQGQIPKTYIKLTHTPLYPAKFWRRRQNNADTPKLHMTHQRRDESASSNPTSWTPNTHDDASDKHTMPFISWGRRHRAGDVGSCTAMGLSHSKAFIKLHNMKDK